MKKQFIHISLALTFGAFIVGTKSSASNNEASFAGKIAELAKLGRIAETAHLHTKGYSPNATPEEFFSSLTPMPLGPTRIAALTEDRNNTVYVNSMKDFPVPFQGVIKLNSDKMYVVSGMVNIGNNAIDLNGAGLKGYDPGKDFVVSAVNGAVLRSRDKDVYLESIGVINASSETKAYDLVDVTGNKFINLFQGVSVLDAPNIQSQGVGNLTGFNTLCMIENYWKSRDGLKIGGNMEKFTATLNYFTGIANGGAALEFLPTANIKDIIVQSCYFVYAGNTGIRWNKGAMVDQGRLTLNLFRGVETKLDGFNSFTPGWEMRDNGEGIPDSRANGYLYMVDNTAPTGFKGITLYGKINGKTITVKSDKFTVDQPNKFTFTGKRLTALNVTAIVSATAPDENGSYSIAIMKNGKETIAPGSTITGVQKGRGFQLYLTTQVDMISGDYIEVVMKNNLQTTPVVVNDLQFKVYE
jgi:hypothetical protein